MYLRCPGHPKQSMWVLVEHNGTKASDFILRESSPDHNADYYIIYKNKIQEIDNLKKKLIVANDNNSTREIESYRSQIQTMVKQVNNAVFSHSDMTSNVIDGKNNKQASSNETENMEENETDNMEETEASPIALVRGFIGETGLSIESGILQQFLERDSAAWYQNTTKSIPDILGDLRRAWIALDNKMHTYKQICKTLEEEEDMFDTPVMLQQGFPMQVFLDAKRRQSRKQDEAPKAPRPPPTQDQITKMREIKENLQRKIKHGIEKINKLTPLAEQKLTTLSPQAATNYKENNKMLHKADGVIKKHNAGQRARQLRKKATKANKGP